MIRVGVVEAKASFSTLLDRVSEGEEFEITRRGKPIARLCSPEIGQTQSLREIGDRIIALRKELGLRGWNWREMRDEGRR